MQTKVVVFDLGKVLLDFDYHAAAAHLAEHAAVSGAEIYRHLMQSGRFHHYENGLMTTAEFFREFCAATGYRGSLAQFEPSLGRIFYPIQPMIEFHQQLRARGVPTWILSNTNEIAVRLITEDFPFFRQFTGYVYSFETRSLKPDAAIYEALERRAGARGAEIIYLDDRPENVAAGAARGWQALVHADPAITIPAVLCRL
jgi:FMN phosphatase YigB (HAD superfamily)